MLKDVMRCGTLHSYVEAYAVKKGSICHQTGVVKLTFIKEKERLITGRITRIISSRPQNDRSVRPSFINF